MNTLVKTKLGYYLNKAGIKPKKLKKLDGDSKIIAELILCVVVVALGIVFRDKISTVITSVINTVSSKITGVFSA